MDPGIDPSSPVPLYHQIAEAIRGRIDRGELKPGDAVEPLREAAERWGVNLHTVRHAYTALARDGIVETRGTRGTRVAGQAAAREEEADPRVAFLEEVVKEAHERFGMDRRGLMRAIEALGEGRREVVYVVECSEWQCESHCRELRERFEVEAHPWSLGREGEPGEGTVLATYFHYNDIRRRWADRLRRVRFVTIGPDPAIAGLVGAREGRVVVFERDEETAANVAADVGHVLGREVGARCGDNPAAVIEQLGPGGVMLVAPRVWAELDERVREHPGVHEARYVFDDAELGELARELGWRPRRRAALTTGSRR